MIALLGGKIKSPSTRLSPSPPSQKHTLAEIPLAACQLPSLLPAALHPSTLLLVLLFVDSLISTMQILYFLFVLQLFYFLSLENQYNTANELLLYFITTKREKQ